MGTDSGYGTTTEGQIGAGSTPYYNAGPGYDLATGLGTIDGNLLLTDWGKVSFAGTRTTLTSSAASFVHGTAVAVAGSVTNAGGAVPTGTVALMTSALTLNNQQEGSFPLAGGSFTGSVDTLPGGTYTVFGRYGGDASNAASTSTPVSLTVTPETSATSLNLSGTEIGSNTGNAVNVPYGSSISLNGLVAPVALLTAYVSCTYGISPTCPVFGMPTGTMAFTDAGTALGMVPLTANGKGSYTYVPGVGSHTVTASYSGDPSYTASSAGPTAFQVMRATPSISVGTQSGTGGGVSLMAILVRNGVRGGAAGTAPTGTVLLTSTNSALNGSVVLASVLDPFYGLEGYATFPIPVGAGLTDVKFTYSGDGNYTPLTYNGLVYGVPASSQLSSTTTLTSTATTVSPQMPVLLTAVVSAQAGHPVPTGTISLFTDLYTDGVFTLSAGSGGNGAVTISTPNFNLFAGLNFLTAQYSGDSVYAPSSATIVINNPLSDFALSTAATTLLPVNSAASQAISVISNTGFAGAVALNCSAAGGVTCAVMPGSVTLSSGASAAAMLTVNTAAIKSAGTYNVTLTGTDSTGLLIHTLGLTVVVPSAPDFTLTPASTSVTLAGSSGTDALLLSSVNGFSGAVVLTCSATGGVACSVMPTAVTLASGGTGSSALTLNGAGVTAAGTYTATVTGVDATGAHVHSVIVSVNATPAPVPDFSLAVGPLTSLTGPVTTQTLTLGSINSFAGPVALTCTATGGITCSVTPTSVTLTAGATGTATLSTNISLVKTSGNYTIAVTGTDASGAHVHTVTINTAVSILASSFNLSSMGNITIATQGGTGSTGLTVTPSGPFSGAVNLTCRVTSAPAGASLAPGCTVTTPVAVGLLTPASATLNITTTAQTGALGRSPFSWVETAGGTALAACFGLVLLPKRRRRWAALSVGVLGFGVLTVLVGCGGKSTSTTTTTTTTPSGGTTVGAYTVTVTGTDAATGQLTASVPVSVTVN